MKNFVIGVAGLTFIALSFAVIALSVCLYIGSVDNKSLTEENNRLKADAKGWVDVVAIIKERCQCENQGGKGRGAVGSVE